MERIRKGQDYFGECECCDKVHTEENPVRITVHYGNMWFCDSCWEKESKTTAELKANQQTVNVVTNALQQAARVDNSVQVRTDLFNAQTVSIINLKAEIDNNPEILNKPYVLAEQLMARFEKFKSVIFEYNEKIVEANNAQKAIQVYLNQMANQLRSEEREKLKIADINYQPTRVKPTKPAPIKTTGTKKATKLDKVELRKYAAELGVAEFTLQMVVVAKGCTIPEAAELLKKSIAAAKQTTTE
jgi:hypothetical protein